MTFDEAHDIIIVQPDGWREFYDAFMALMIKGPWAKTNVLDIADRSGLNPFIVRHFLEALTAKGMVSLNGSSVEWSKAIQES